MDHYTFDSGISRVDSPLESPLEEMLQELNYDNNGNMEANTHALRLDTALSSMQQRYHHFDVSPTDTISPMSPLARPRTDETDFEQFTALPPPLQSIPSSRDGNEDALIKTKSPSLIRRISRGAQSSIRRRASTLQSKAQNDQNIGPILVRHRSESKDVSETLYIDATSDFETEGPSSETATMDMSSSFASLEGPSKSTCVTSPTSFEGGIAPTISSVLEQGTYLIKVTRKKRHVRKFRLDTSAAKVCWTDSANLNKQFYIDNVREIRVGAESRSSRQDIHVTPEIENCWMTIVYDKPEGPKDRSIKTMHLIAPNDYIAKLWTDALKSVERERIEIMNALSLSPERSQRSMLMAWKWAISQRDNNDDRITFEDATWICRKLEINCSNSQIRQYFNQADQSMIGMLTYPQYEIFINLFKTRHDIGFIFEAIKPAGQSDLNLNQFLAFLTASQSINVEKDRQFWISKFVNYSRVHMIRNAETPPSDDDVANMRMSRVGFQTFSTSSLNNVLENDSLADLNRPINEYFISSSHNTYLLGRQVAGISSVEGYISALVKGCRCIEVDCWDGKDGRPVVNHGRTMSTDVLFEDCIFTIAKYAFTSSPYPLIISLEVHCGPEQQNSMVEIMVRIFGDALLTAPLQPGACSLPSPEDLRNRILIKVKAAKQVDSCQTPPSTDKSLVTKHDGPKHSSQSTQMSVELANEGSSESTMRSSSTTPSLMNGPISSTSGSDNEVYNSTRASQRNKKTSNIVPSLGALGVYACGVKYSDFSAPEAKTVNHIFSLAENAYNNLCKEPETKRQLQKHNIKHLMRVYPAARRIDSSNFNPLQVWRQGVQMSALNWQTYDVNMQLSEAMFAAGQDRTGYVLKPEGLRLVSQPAVDGPKNGRKFVKFSVEIISARRLPRPRNRNQGASINPYIEFEIFSAEDRSRTVARCEGGIDVSPLRDGSSGIDAPIRRRTKIVEDNGFDPVWKETMTVTVETAYPELIFIRWTVWNSPNGKNLSSNGTMLAVFTAKLDSVQQGFRHIPLFNPYGEKYRDARLFVKMVKDDLIDLHSSMRSETLSPRASSQTSEDRWLKDDITGKEKSWPRKLFSRTPSQRKKSTTTSSTTASRPSLSRSISAE